MMLTSRLCLSANTRLRFSDCSLGRGPLAIKYLQNKTMLWK
ncbi:protein of unknown function [Paraburkholderia dioscoreae]|uniref:Uncharacterized protein n=1 Tax=Paraburkholderia dioscoreae TaxID=2604047 RepID=A0A5Q4ZSN0_9BURK|nr:protein of unknown function [Paraburkholderia dioscoreae]